MRYWLKKFWDTLGVKDHWRDYECHTAKKKPVVITVTSGAPATTLNKFFYVILFYYLPLFINNLSLT